MKKHKIIITIIVAVALISLSLFVGGDEQADFERLEQADEEARQARIEMGIEK